MIRSVEERTHPRAIFLILAVGVVSFALIQSLPIPVLPELATVYRVDPATVAWVVTAYLLSASVATPIVGRIGDSRGKSRALVFCLLALSAGSVISALAPNFGVLIAGRAVQGIGGGILPVSFGIVREELAERQVPAAIALLSSLLAAGIGCGTVMAGPIAAKLGMGWLFWLPAVCTTLTALVAWKVVPESRSRTSSRISGASVVLSSAWLVCLLIGISQGPRWGWTSPAVVALLFGVAVFAVWWVRAELRAVTPLVDMGMMRQRTVWTANLVAFLIGFGMYAGSVFLPQFLQTDSTVGYGFGLSPSMAGLLLFPSAAASFVVGLVAAPLARRIGSRMTIASGASVAAVAMLAIAFVHEQQWQVVVAYTFSGLGLGLVFAALAAVVVGAVPSHQTGVASGMNTNIRTVGGAVGTAVVSTLVAVSAVVPSESGYTAGFAVLGSALVAAAVVTAAMPRRSVVSKKVLDVAVPA